VWAAAQALRRHVDLRLVHAVSLPAYPFDAGFTPPPDFFAGLESEAQDLLSRARTYVVARYPKLTVTAELRTGQPAGALIEESRSAVLVVLGVHAPRPQRLPLGSTAVSVAAHGQCPVAVIHDRGDDQELPNTGPVVVGMDGSSASEAAVAIAFEEASARAAELVAVHAWDAFASNTEYLYARQFLINWAPMEEREREILAERLAGWQEKYPDVTVRRELTLEKPAHALLEYGATAQLVVVGSRGRGGFAGMLLGSVSQKLIHQATCPLIVARPAASG
jgi:nucleotide-binding universal stress UspA family protein